MSKRRCTTLGGERNEVRLFAPQDQRDFEWYFSLGPAPQDLTRKQRERWGEIHRALDGWSHNLCEYFTALQRYRSSPDPELPPLEEIPLRVANELRRVREEEHSSAARLCCNFAEVEVEYRRYIEQKERRSSARRRGRPSQSRMSHVVVSYDDFLLAIPVSIDTRWSHRQQKNIQEKSEPEKDLTRELRESQGMIARSAWGQIRIDVTGAFRAARLLQLTNIGKDDFALLELLKKTVTNAAAFERSRRQGSAETAAHDDREETKPFVSGERRALLEFLHEIGLNDASLLWDRRDDEKHLGKPETTVSEIAKRAHVPREKVRQLLTRYYGEIRPREGISLQWLASPDGRKFWTEAVTVSRRPR